MNNQNTEREAAAVLHLASLLRSMASSYAAGHQWDALDSKAVTDAATVLEGFARSQQPATATNTREALTRIAEICECHPMYLGAGLSIEEICKEGGDAATITDMAYIAREALEAAAVEAVQPATAVPADLPQALRVALEDLDSFESLGPTTEAVINAAQQWYLSVPAAPPATAVQAASPSVDEIVFALRRALDKTDADDGRAEIVGHFCNELNVLFRASPAVAQAASPGLTDEQINRQAVFMWGSDHIGQMAFRQGAEFARAALAAPTVAPDGDRIPMPQNARQAQGMVNLGLMWLKDRAPELLRAPTVAQAGVAAPKLQVWYGAMPESNGKSNFTAILHKGDLAEGHTIARSEYPDRVRYFADHVRYLLGEIERPDILAYDEAKHSGYVEPATAPSGQDADLKLERNKHERHL